MGDVDARKITLAPELAAAVDEAVASGEYPSVSAVLDEALGRWKEERENFGYTREELRALVQEGIDSGPARDGEAALDRVLARYRAELGAK